MPRDCANDIVPLSLVSVRLSVCGRKTLIRTRLGYINRMEGYERIVQHTISSILGDAGLQARLVPGPWSCKKVDNAF